VQTTIPPLDLEPVEKAINLEGRPAATRMKIAGELCVEVRTPGCRAEKTATGCLCKKNQWKDGLWLPLTWLPVNWNVGCEGCFIIDPEKAFREAAQRKRRNPLRNPEVMV